MPRSKTAIKRRRRRRGRGLEIQNLLSKTGIEYHVPGYQCLGLGTKLKKRLARGDPGKNRLDRIAKQHDIDYFLARNLRDKWKADNKMIKAINNLPDRKIMTERAIRKSMQAMKRMKL